MPMFDGGLILTTKPDRRDLLTVREVARLQGFTDDFVFYNSETSQYKDVLKALPPIVAKQIAEIILHVIRSSRVMRLDNPGEVLRARKRARVGNEREGGRSWVTSLSSAPE
jgi:hypothetical protein